MTLFLKYHINKVILMNFNININILINISQKSLMKEKSNIISLKI